MYSLFYSDPILSSRLEVALIIIKQNTDKSKTQKIQGCKEFVLILQQRAFLSSTRAFVSFFFYSMIVVSIIVVVVVIVMILRTFINLRKEELLLDWISRVHFDLYDLAKLKIVLAK